MKKLFTIAHLLLINLVLFGQASFNVKNFGLGGNSPRSISLADLNDDGKLDIATADDFRSSINNVSVYLNNGSENFALSTYNSADNTAVAIYAGDLNGDNKSDLAIANVFGNNISVLLNKGNGTFENAVTYAVEGQPMGICIGDLNNDGKADIASTNSCTNCSSISIFLNKGNGTFNTPINIPTGISTYSLAIGDFNNDGNNDIVATHLSYISVFQNNGDGTFADPIIYNSGNPIGVSIGDLNNDGYIDLAVSNGSSNNVSVLLNNNDGTFSKAINYPVGQYPFNVSIGDINGDGKPDLASSNYWDNTISILLNAGSGTFVQATNYSVGQNPYFVAIGDLNSDGKMDLAVAESDPKKDVTVLFNTTKTTTTGIDLSTSSSKPVVYCEGKTIHIQNKDPKAIVNIYDLRGQLLYEGVSSEITLKNTSSGIYFAKVDLEVNKIILE